jgi:diadenosine tetraphosphate (Ap4A) HIT family hydrolase
VLPRRHVPSIFDLADAELAAIGALVRHVRAAIAEEDPQTLGFNVGVNDGWWLADRDARA